MWKMRMKETVVRGAFDHQILFYCLLQLNLVAIMHYLVSILVRLGNVLKSCGKEVGRSSANNENEQSYHLDCENDCL